MNKRMLELYQQAHIDYTAIDPSNNMPYKSAMFSPARFSELIVSECMDVLTDVLPPNVPESRDGIHPVWHIKQHFGVE